MIKWTVDTNELAEVQYQMEGCANALNLMCDTLSDYDGKGFRFIADSISALADHIGEVLKESQKVKVGEEDD